MKNIFLSILFCFLLNPLISQQVFNKSFGLSPNTQWTESIAVDDGFTILAGSTSVDIENGDDVLLVKIDAEGQELWQKNIGGIRNEGASKVIVVDEGYLIAGYTKSYGNGGMDFYQILTDKDGNVLWERTFGTEAHEWCRDIIETDDGGYLLFGEINREGIGQDWWVLKTDANGNEEWSQYFGFDERDQAKFVKDLPDGYLLGGSFGRKRAAIKLTSEGDEEWTLVIDQGFQHSRTAFNEMTILGNNDLLLVGTNGAATSSRVSPEGTLLWDKTYPIGINAYNSAEAVLELSIDSIFIIRNLGYSAVAHSFLNPLDGSELQTYIVSFPFEDITVNDMEATSSNILYAGANPVGMYSNLPIGYSAYKYSGFTTFDWSTATSFEFEFHNEFGKNVIQTNEGDYIFSGFRENKIDILLSKTDEDGVLIWEKVIDTSAYRPIDMLYTHDGNVVMVNALQDSILRIVKLDDNGEMVWEQFTETVFDYYEVKEVEQGRIVQTSDNGFLILTNSINCQSIRLDENGTVLWVNTGGCMNDVVLQPDNSFWKTSANRLSLHDADATWIGTYFYNYLPIPENQNFQAMTKTADGGFLMSGVVQQNEDDPYQHFIIKVDANLAIVFQKTLEGEAKIDGDMKVIELEDGSIIILGTKQQAWPYDQSVFGSTIIMDCFYHELESAFVEKRGADGSFQWREELGPYKNVVDGMIDSDGNIIVSGWHYNQNTFDHLLVKIDPAGIVNVGPNLDSKQFEPVIYPNPGFDELTIHFEHTLKKDLEIQVYDAFGRLVETVQSKDADAQSKFQIDTKVWKPGMYFIRFLNKGETIKTVKWMKIE